jgi:gastric triacylglycerol lipase
LSDNGYDVWLGNARGTDLSQGHTHLNQNASEFWNFSFHEIGLSDLPAMIDFILSQTESLKLFYVAHSQGTSAILALLTSKPEYSGKVIQAHLLAPAAILYNRPEMENFRNEIDVSCVHCLIGFFLNFHFQTFFHIVHEGAFGLISSELKAFLSQAANSFCQLQHGRFCLELYYQTAGRNKNGPELDMKIILSILNQNARKIAVKQLHHYWQLVKSGNFCQFDYEIGNQKIYNSTSVPCYNLKNFKVPTFIYSGGCDT